MCQSEKGKIIYSKNSACQGLGRQSTGNFGGSETIMYDTTVVDTCHHIFVQTHRVHNTRSDP